MPEGGSVDEKTGVVKEKPGADGKAKAVGVKIGEKIYKGFDTPTRKLEITSTFLKRTNTAACRNIAHPRTRRLRSSHSIL